MSLLGIQTVTYGIEDTAKCRRFWSDFGLQAVEDTPQQAIYATPEGAQVVLRDATDRALPTAPVPGPTVREVTWAASDDATLARIADELARDREVRVEGGRVCSVDPAGHAIAFERSRLTPAHPAATPFNTPGHTSRVDARALLYPQAHPTHLAHVVFAVQNLEETARFYVDRLGFRLTDSYRDSGVFLRCDGASDHHNLFLLRRGDAVGFHHIAFDMRDIHEVFGGGLHMTSQGWQTHIGPGRHPVSSAYFWYFRNPCGGAAEYDFDTDVVTDAWVARVFEPTPEAFAEWAFADGARRYDGMQTGRV